MTRFRSSFEQEPHRSSFEPEPCPSSFEPAPREEGRIARAIEEKARRRPWDFFLWGAAGAAGSSLLLRVLGKREISSFVGQWAPTLLILGLYDRLVRLLGSRWPGQSVTAEV